MLAGTVTKYGIRLALSLIVGLALVSLAPVPAQAEDPVIDLVLGGEGATSWNIINIKPGDSGTKTVTLHNAGYRDGSITIWVSDIGEIDYGGDGAVLDEYLLFNLSCDRLSTNMTLPATINELPQNSFASDYIKVSRLYAGETVTLVWEWEFSETGEPQNDAQGDSLSFTINYLLEELPSGSTEDYGWKPSYQQLEIDILGKVTLAKVSSSGELLGSYLAADTNNKHRLEFNKGTRVTSTSGKIPRRIQMKVYEKSLSAPEGMELIGPAYELTGCIYGSAPCSVIFSPPAKMTLSYEPGWLPEDTPSILIASCDAEQGWRELELPSGSAAEMGEITALISHTSTFAILAKLAKSPPPASPPAPPPAPTGFSLAPAKFELSDLAINSAQAKAGEPVTISTIVQNTGELEGSCTLALKINGQIEQVKEVNLAGGKSTEVSFILIKDDPGTYIVSLGGQTESFTILLPSPASSWASIHWWPLLLDVAIVSLPGCFLLIYLLLIMSKPTHNPATPGRRQP